MSDEYLEPELDSTPTERDVDEAYGSRFLGVTDVTKKIRTKILKVRKEDVKDRESGKLKKKIIVFFESIDKGLILNVTNKNILAAGLGKSPANWIGASVGIFVDPTVGFGGKQTGGVRLRVLLPPAAAKPAPAAATPPAAADGDPGFDPDFNDNVSNLAAG